MNGNAEAMKAGVEAAPGTARIPLTPSLSATDMTYHAVVETTAIASCVQGDLVQIRGTVRSVTLLPKDAAPRFEVAIEDASGVVTLTWLGRRRIVGIEPGRDLTVTGRMTCEGAHRRIFNPRYTLWPVSR